MAQQQQTSRIQLHSASRAASETTTTMPRWSAAAIAILATVAVPYGGDAFVPNAHRPVVKTSLDAIGVFFGTSTGSTEEAAHLISAEFGDAASEPIDIDGIQGSVRPAHVQCTCTFYVAGYSYMLLISIGCGRVCKVR